MKWYSSRQPLRPLVYENEGKIPWKRCECIRGWATISYQQCDRCRNVLSNKMLTPTPSVVIVSENFHFSCFIFSRSNRLSIPGQDHLPAYQQLFLLRPSAPWRYKPFSGYPIGCGRW